MVTMERHFVADGANSFWVVCVDCVTGSAGVGSQHGAPGRAARKVDCREVLDPEQFETQPGLPPRPSSARPPVRSDGVRMEPANIPTRTGGRETVWPANARVRRRALVGVAVAPSTSEGSRRRRWCEGRPCGGWHPQRSGG